MQVCDQAALMSSAPPPCLTVRGQTGMVARLTSSEQENFIGLISAIGAGDASMAAHCVIGFAENTNLSPRRGVLTPAGAAFERDMHALFARICRGYGTGVDCGEVCARVNCAPLIACCSSAPHHTRCFQVMRGVLGLVRDHRVAIGVNYATLFVNVRLLLSFNDR